MVEAFYKKKKGDRIWWTRDIGAKGRVLFSFDKKTIYNFFVDYPNKLSKEEKDIFDKENPEWAAFYRGEYKAEEVK